MKKRDDIKLVISILFVLIATCLTSCYSDYCDEPYVTSEVWMANSTSEPLYYAFTDKPYLTPDCIPQKLPVQLAYILNFKQFTPSQVLANPTYTANTYHFHGENEKQYRYMLLLRYDDSLVACYDISRSALAKARYPWFSPKADSTEILRSYEVCGDKPEITYKYIYYITDSIL